MSARMGQSIIAVSFAFGCASLPATEPEDMGAPEHQAAARVEEDVAKRQEALYDPAATIATELCQPPLVADFSTSGTCWVEYWNPTEEHLREAAHHRRVAARHRAASKELVDAESRACGTIAPVDRDRGPFATRADAIRSVEAIVDDGEVEGAVISFRNAEGVTEETMEAVVRCHLARNAARGHVVAELPDCPLVPKGIDVSVSDDGAGGVLVRILGSDRSTAEEVLARARRSATRSP